MNKFNNENNGKHHNYVEAMVFNPHLPIWQIKENISSLHSTMEASVVIFCPTILFPSLICNGMIKDLKPLHDIRGLPSFKPAIKVMGIPSIWVI
jgi:hypothetical protein